MQKSVQTAKQQQKKARPRALTRKTGTDLRLLLLILALAIYGSLMVYSASSAYAATRFSDAYYFAKRQLVFLLLGIAVMLGVSQIPMDRFRRISRPLFGICLFLLALVPIIGSEAGGAKRWISLGPLTLQPSELAKTALILLLSYYFTSEKTELAMQEKHCARPFLYGILYPILLFLLPCGLVMLEKHLSCVIILGVITVSMIFLAGANGKILGALSLGGAGAVATFALAVEYTRRRITIWLNPELYPRDGGWQTLQGLMAIGSGGLFGLGFGNSRLKHLYVSEPQNDFIFTIACEELGFIGAISILLLFALFVLRGIEIGASHPDRFSSFVAVGISVKVAIQVLLNLAVITNTLPNTGISLPFFSYGGSSLVVLFAEMGILLSASRDSHIKR